LAKLGHTVHVVTNAKEANAPYRMFMREEDWARCEQRYDRGSVQVHWTESYGGREWHIPDNAPFVSKLASLGLDLATSQGIDLIYSHYVEPYCVASHIVAQATGLPHVVRTAGSDAGRLWDLPQYSALYTHIFRTADGVICGPSVARKMVEAGVDSTRVVKPETHLNLLDLFAAEGPILDVPAFRSMVAADSTGMYKGTLYGEFDPNLSYFGVYGKLGRNKGTPALLAAVKKLREGGVPVGLLVMAHERPGKPDGFQEYVKANGLERSVCQLPFVPHWRVPEFIRRCVSVCCLEQDFPIKFHNPVVAREVLTCGGALIASAEIIQKLPQAHKLIDGSNCIRVDDVNDVDKLAQRLVFVLERPDATQEMRRRAREYAIEIETREASFLWLESALLAAPNRRPPSHQQLNQKMPSTSAGQRYNHDLSLVEG
jgi:glycosyltransferase involved in cell wall biosynthesis